jgi:hypothetical protein
MNSSGYHVHEDLRLLEKVHEIFVNLRDADGGGFPPFAVTEALIRNLVSLIKDGHGENR